ncbi:MAG: transcriptional regulator [Hyphomicrobiaceae bacterium]
MENLKTQLFKHAARLVTAAFVMVSAHAFPALAAELVMLEQRGCAWCLRWHKEIGLAYPNTAEGRRAPLRIVDINRPLPEDLAGLTVDRFTPTFVLFHEGREVGRMRGYAGDEFFWYLLAEMLAKLPPPPSE